MDDTLVAIPEALLSSGAAIEKRFGCRDRQFLPSYFKGVEVIQEGPDIVLYQMTYIHTNGKSTAQLSNISKLDNKRDLIDSEITKHRTVAGRLAWIGTGSSPTSSRLASMALQEAKETVTLLNSCQDAYVKVDREKLARLHYVPLDFKTVQIRVFSDGSFQNLSNKHSQIGFVIILEDANDHYNIFTWHSCRATRREWSTKEAELFALDSALLRLRNQRDITFQLLKKKVPHGGLNRQTSTLANLMNTTASSMSEVMYRCR